MHIACPLAYSIPRRPGSYHDFPRFYFASPDKDIVDDEQLRGNGYAIAGAFTGVLGHYTGSVLLDPDSRGC